MEKKSLNILAFGSHPDDIELGCAGTLEQFKRMGHQIHFAIMTSGEAGSLKISPNKLRILREKESKAAAKVLGVNSVRFLGFPDIHGERKRENFFTIVKLIRVYKPDLILTHSLYDKSADHKFYTQMVLDATFSAAGPWIQEVGLSPHEVKNIWGYEVWSPIPEAQLVIPIKKKKKVEALRCHQSQMKDMGYIEAILGLNRYRGELSGQSEYAEAFQVIKQSIELFH